MSFAPTAIDVSRLPPPDVLEDIDFDVLLAGFIGRFESAWAEEQASNPALLDYSVGSLIAPPVNQAGRADTWQGRLDRQRVNDVAKALTAAFAKKSDLDHFVARNNVVRLEVSPAVGDQPAVMESDERLLYRYLLSFAGRSAGSRERYMFEALTAVPVIPTGGVAVRGHRVHGRRGDVDIVVSGPDGRDVTDEELTVARGACLADHVVPEATHAQVIRAMRYEYQVAHHIVVAQGASPSLVQAEAETRLRAATDERTLIGAKVVRDFLSGAVRGLSVIDGTMASPSDDIEAEPYTVPVCTNIAVTVEVAS